MCSSLETSLTQSLSYARLFHSGRQSLSGFPASAPTLQVSHGGLQPACLHCIRAPVLYSQTNPPATHVPLWAGPCPRVSTSQEQGHQSTGRKVRHPDQLEVQGQEDQCVPGCGSQNTLHDRVALRLSFFPSCDVFEAGAAGAARGKGGKGLWQTWGFHSAAVRWSPSQSNANACDACLSMSCLPDSPVWMHSWSFAAMPARGCLAVPTCRIIIRKVGTLHMLHVSRIRLPKSCCVAPPLEPSAAGGGAPALHPHCILLPQSGG